MLFTLVTFSNSAIFISSDDKEGRESLAMTTLNLVPAEANFRVITPIGFSPG